MAPVNGARGPGDSPEPLRVAIVEDDVTTRDGLAALIEGTPGYRCVGRYGSVEELLRDGETGVLVPARDPSALAAALDRLARDPALRRRLADAGHAAVAREFDLERTAAAYTRRFQGAA